MLSPVRHPSKSSNLEFVLGTPNIEPYVLLFSPYTVEILNTWNIPCSLLPPWFLHMLFLLPRMLYLPLASPPFLTGTLQTMLLIRRFIFHSEHIRQWEKYSVQEVIPLTTESHHPPWLPVLGHRLHLSLCSSSIAPAILYLVLITN